MKFALQAEYKDTIEAVLVVEKIKRQFIHELIEVPNNMVSFLNKDDMKDYIPIGDIPFVTKWIKKAYGIEKMNPIEVPKCLREEEFLGRKYEFLLGSEIKEGNKFIKDVDTLKNFSYSGYVDKSMLNDDTLYQVSENIAIKAEFRVYVFGGQISNMAQYDGDWTIFPDTDKIKKMVKVVNEHEKHLKSYTLDIAVTADNNTVVLEVHNFVAIGLYNSLIDSNILYAYRDGIDYLLNDNKSIRKEMNLC